VALAFALVCAGCNGTVPSPALLDTVNTLGPIVSNIVADTVPGAAPVLTAAEALACKVQSDANAIQPPSPLATEIATEAGDACKW
jgi:hypothetical protein